MKKLMCAFLSLVMLLSATACESSDKEEKNNDKLDIVTTLYPQYDFTKHIVGDKANVTLLLDPGTEAHTYDPSAKDIIKIEEADMFIYTGKYMELWADDIISSISDKDLVIVDASAGITLSKTEDEDHEDHEDHEEHHHEYDPHIWTNPQYAIKMIDTITTALCNADPDNSQYYKNNAKEYSDQISDIDKQIEEAVNKASNKKIYFAGEFAMFYFAQRYGLDYVAAFDDCSEHAEPSAKRIADIINSMKADNSKVIYYQELTDPKIANSIAKETGAKPLVLNSAHNLSKEQFDSGLSYADIMKQNLENIKEGLD